MAVHKEYRQQGLATLMLQKVEDYVKAKGGRYLHILSCDIDYHIPARAFYEKHGFQKVGYMPNYYVPGEGRIDYYKELL